MELLLIMVLAGLCFWLMKPLRDWYVVEVSAPSGHGGLQYAFKTPDQAETEFDRMRQELRNSGRNGQIFLWKVEARSGMHARKIDGGSKEEHSRPILLKFDEIA